MARCSCTPAWGCWRRVCTRGTICIQSAAVPDHSGGGRCHSGGTTFRQSSSVNSQRGSCGKRNVVSTSWGFAHRLEHMLIRLVCDGIACQWLVIVGDSHNSPRTAITRLAGALIPAPHTSANGEIADSRLGRGGARSGSCGRPCEGSHHRPHVHGPIPELLLGYDGYHPARDRPNEPDSRSRQQIGRGQQPTLPSWWRARSASLPSCASHRSWFRYNWFSFAGAEWVCVRSPAPDRWPVPDGP